jgi:hypothetical protein
MDEFLSIALWIMVGFITINGMIIWFNSDPTFTQNGLGLDASATNSSYGQSYIDNAYNVSCDAVSSNIFSYAICYFNQLTSLANSLIGTLLNFLFAWTGLINAICSMIPGGDLFRIIFLPFLGLTEVTAILLIVMKLAAIARGIMGI